MTYKELIAKALEAENRALAYSEKMTQQMQDFSRLRMAGEAAKAGYVGSVIEELKAQVSELEALAFGFREQARKQGKNG